MIGRRVLLPALAGAALLFATPGGLGKPAPGDVPPDFRSLAGQLLIAAPSMRDPRFQQTVIVMLRHDASGALGIVVNRPLGERALAQLLAAAGASAEGVEGGIAVHYGGPVEPGIGLLLHSGEYEAPGTLRVTAQLAWTGTVDVLRDLGRGLGPRRFLFALGYAGWGPGQLEGEMARGFWFTAAGDTGLIFDADRGSLWDQAMARRTRSL